MKTKAHNTAQPQEWNKLKVVVLGVDANAKVGNWVAAHSVSCNLVPLSHPETDFNQLIAMQPDVLVVLEEANENSAADTVEAIKKLDLGVPIVVVAEKWFGSRSVQCIQAGAFDYVLMEELKRLKDVFENFLVQKNAGKRAERGAKLSELSINLKRLQLSEKIVRSASWEWNIKKNEIWWSDQLYNLFQKTPASFHLTPDTALNYLPDNEREPMRTMLLENPEGLKEFNRICKVQLDDGSVLKINNKGILELDASGTPEKWHGVVVDVTEKIEQENELLRLNEVVNTVENAVKREIGANYFREIVVLVNAKLGADYTFIAQLNNKRTIANTLYFADKKGLAFNFTYNLEHAPCNEVTHQKQCIFSKNVQDEFPEDVLLKEMGIMSYFGAPLMNPASDQADHIFVSMFCAPQEDVGTLSTLFSIFSEQIQIELDRDRLYNQLFQNEQRLNMAVDASQLGTFDWDISKNEVVWNHWMNEICGVPLSEEQDKVDYLLDIVHEEDKQSIVEEFTKLLDPTSSNKDFERRFRIIKNGEDLKYIKLKGHLLRGTNNEVIRILGVCLDKTEEVSRREVLMSSESKWRKVFNSYLDIYYETNLYGDFEMLSPSLTGIMGYEPEDLIGSNVIEIYKRTKDREILLEILNEKEKLEKYALEVVTKTGETKYIETSARLRKDEEGIVNGVIGVARDVTSKIIKEKELKLSEEKFRGVFESFLDVYFETDIVGNIVLVTPSVATILGYEPSELIGKNFINYYVFEEDRGRLLKELWRGAKIDGFECLLLHKNGQEVALEINFSWRKDSQGNNTGIRGTARDVTKRKGHERTEKLYSVALQSMVEGILILEQDHLIIGSNSAALELLGVAQQDLADCDLYNPPWAAVEEGLGEFDNREHPALRTLKTGQSVQDVIMGIRHPNKEIKWISVNSSPLFYKNRPERSLPDAVICTFHDITTNKQKDAQIKTIINTVPHMIFAKNASNKFLFANRATTNMLQTTAQGIKGKTLEDFKTSISKQEVLALNKGDLEVIHNNRAEYILEESYTDQKGNKKWVQSHKIPFDYDGEKAVLGVSVDITEIKYLEQLIKNSEEKYRMLTENAPVGIIIHAEGEIKYYNSAAAQILKGTERDLRLYKMDKIIHPDFKAQAGRRMESLIKEPVDVQSSIEEKFLCFDGTVIDVMVMGTVMEYQNRKAVQEVFYDVSDKKQYERKLIERENLLSTVLNSMFEGLILYDMNGAVLDFNGASMQILGLNGGQIKGDERLPKNWKFVQEDLNDYDPEEHPLQVTLKTGIPVHNVVLGVYHGKDQIKWVNANAEPFRDPEDGRTMGVVLTYLDITEMKLRNIKLKQLALVAEKTHNSIVIANEKGDVEWVNRAFEKTTGFKEKEVKSKKLSEVLYSTDTHHGVKRFVKDQLQKEENFRAEVLLEHKSGRKFWMDMDVQPVFDMRGRLKNYISVQNDITEQVKNEKRKTIYNEINKRLILNEEISENIKNILQLLTAHLNGACAEYYHNVDGQNIRHFSSYLIKKSRIHKEVFKGGEVFPVNEILKGQRCQLVRAQPEEHSWALNLMHQHRTILGIPVFTSTNSIGTILLYDINEALLDAEEEEMLNNVGHQFGQFMARYNYSEQLLESIEEKDVLFKEVHHRVKNNLQLIVSTLYLKLYAIDDVMLRDKFEDIITGVKSIAIIHEQLLQSKKLNTIELSDYIEKLVNEIPMSLGIDAESVAILVEFEKKIVKMDFAVNFGLLINELMVNALKHAFDEKLKAQRKPQITITMHSVSNATYEMVFKDNGVGMSKKFKDLENQSSLGLNLIHSFASQLKATIDVTTEKGTAYKFIFPLKG